MSWLSPNYAEPGRQPIGLEVRSWVQEPHGRPTNRLTTGRAAEHVVRIINHRAAMVFFHASSDSSEALLESGNTNWQVDGPIAAAGRSARPVPLIVAHPSPGTGMSHHEVVTTELKVGSLQTHLYVTSKVNLGVDVAP